jgi:hypothetical protein
MASPRMALGDDPRGIRDVSEGDQLAPAQLDRTCVPGSTQASHARRGHLNMPQYAPVFH